MLKLVSAPVDPYWINLVPGVRVQVRPLSVAAVLLARAEAADHLAERGDKPERAVTVAAGAAFARSLARSAIVAWEGVGDADGTPIEPTPDRIDQLMDLWPAFDAFDRAYVAPALARADEKNG